MSWIYVSWQTKIIVNTFTNESDGAARPRAANIVAPQVNHNGIHTLSISKLVA
jgi:hypothetical protein